MKQLLIYGLAIIGFLHVITYVGTAIMGGFIIYACMTHGGC